MGIEIDITTNIGCPMKCVYCPQDVLIEAYGDEERFLTLENLKKIVDKTPEYVNITFAGMSEPWINPKCTEMVLYAHNNNHTVGIYTTGVGMKPQDVDMIKHIPFAIFMLHLPDTLNAANIPTTQKHFNIIMKLKEATLHNFKVSSMGTPYKEFVHFSPYLPMSLNSRAGTIQHPNIRKFKKKVGHITCGQESHPRHIEMLPNGNVYICCQDYGLKHKIGNLFTDKYYDLFKSEGYKKVVDGLRDDKVDIICRKCEWALTEKQKNMMENKMKVIFMDRDDTLLVDKQNMYKVEDIEFMPHVVKALKKLQKEYEVVIVTNQPGLGRGVFTVEDHTTFTREYIRLLHEEGITIRRIFVCPHAPQDKCKCRKPEIGMVEKFIKDSNVDIENSWVIGDRESDVDFADNLGCRAIRLMNLKEAAYIIMGEEDEDIVTWKF